MAYFAQIDKHSIVIQVLETDDSKPAKGLHWLRERLGGDWVETFIDNSARKNYAGIGYTFDADRNAFIPPKPFDSWVLDEDTCQWSAPVPYPTDGAEYYWDEGTTSWAEAVDE